MASRVGQEVGYQVGMQSKKTAVTKILFMTDHILLNECLKDSTLSKYSCVIIDEAHERSIFTDLLIGMLKECLKTRSDLRVVITSATIDPEVFVAYFGGKQNCPVLSVSGRTFPVEVIWEHVSYRDSSFPEDYEKKALETTIQIHSDTAVAEGDILVFLTSQLEIERCCERFLARCGNTSSTCLPLHGKLKAEEQQLVFEKNPPGKRKVVFATNSAETSITIPGIKFVVDTGVVKEMRYDPKRNMNSLDVMPVSRSSANQRKGRAGRTAPGVCYRLYTQEDFNKMNRTNCPEILRIHLGQGILKLMELQVNPMSFDFVECPSADAMETAFQSLVDIGAVSGSEITELGKWAAKLPVEPRLGVMIKQGIDAGVPVETLVLSASCSQGGIFYRAGSQQEKKEADTKKVRFCHKGGDLLTVLNVYREWDKVNEKGKGGWCKTNCINGKSMKGVREMVKEILTILQKECNIKIKYELKAAEEADDLVQKLLFTSYKSNISFYLGHEQAGYLTAQKQQHVQVHPSSCLRTLAMQPSWVVFSQLLKTTDDFITNITPVKEEDIDAALANKEIELDKESLEKRKVVRALRQPVGKHVFWKFVGPMHKNRREVESNIRAICNDTVVVVEADKLRGEICLYCVERYREDAAKMLLDAIRPLSQSLLLESREEPIGLDRSNVRILLRQGCAGIDILMPHQYRTVQLKQKDFCRFELTEDNVEDLFSYYGQIEQVWRPFGKKHANSNFWGRVTFVNEADAVEAVNEISADENCDFTVQPMKNDSPFSRSQEFTIRLQWCRRPSKGLCYVHCDRPEDISQLLDRQIQVSSSGIVTTQPSRGPSHIMIKGLSEDVTEDQVKDGLADCLGINLPRNSGRFNVIIPRQDVGYHDKGRMKDKVASKIADIIESQVFQIDIRDFKEKTAFCTAFVKFQNAQHCAEVAEYFKANTLNIDPFTMSAKVKMDFKASVFVPKQVYHMVQQDINDYIHRKNTRGSSTTLDFKELKSGNRSVDISASSPLKLAKVKLELDTIVQGDVLEAGDIENLQVLFTADARQMKQQIEKKTKTIIIINDRSMKVTIQGCRDNKANAVQMLTEYIARVGTASERSIGLKGENNPPGLMKAVLVTYSSNLHELKTTYGLVGASMHLQDHILSITGDESALVDAEAAISKLRDKLWNEEHLSIDVDEADCPVCTCPVDVGDSQRLEYCGHAYCRICLISLIEHAIKDRSFPIKCASENCGKDFVIRDINFQVKAGKVNKKDYVDAAVSCFVAKNNTQYKYCITPDCDMIYKVTSSSAAFRCCKCHVEICTSCHIMFHQGLTCDMYKSAKAEQNTLKAWLRENPEKRKLCPKCEVGIEKIEGCDHMTCTSCKAHICWKCLKYFSSSRECYGHMNTAHGSFV